MNLSINNDVGEVRTSAVLRALIPHRALNSLDLQRLNVRIRTMLLSLSVFSLISGVIASFLSNSAWPLSLSVVAAVTIVTMVKLEPDIVIVFFIVSPSLNYVITSQLYALFQGNLNFSGFYDLALSAMVVMTYQIATFCAYLVYSLLGTRRPLVDRADEMVLYRRALFVAVASVSVLLITRLISFGQSLLAIFIPLAWWSVGAVGSRVGPKNHLMKIFAITSTYLLVVSFLLNQRTYVATAAIAGFVIIAAKAKRIISFRNLAVGLVGVFLANILSISILAARPSDRSSMSFGSTTMLALEAAASPETWLHALPFFSSESGAKYRAERTSKYYSDYLSGGAGETLDNSDSLGARLAQIGHLDIVVGQKAMVTSVDQDSLRAEFAFVLPGLSSDSDIAALYSDVIVWDMGLRQNQLVGRPLLTVAGEMYLILGIYVFPFFAFGVALILLLELTILRAAAGYSVAYVVVAIVGLYTITFTGTMLTVLDLIIRVLPLLIIFLAILRPIITLKQKTRQGDNFDLDASSKELGL